MVIRQLVKNRIIGKDFVLEGIIGKFLSILGASLGWILFHSKSEVGGKNRFPWIEQQESVKVIALHIRVCY